MLSTSIVATSSSPAAQAAALEQGLANAQINLRRNMEFMERMEKQKRK